MAVSTAMRGVLVKKCENCIKIADNSYENSSQHADVTKACDQFPVTRQRSYDLVRCLLTADERLK